MFVDTPLADVSLARRLAAMAEVTDLTTRFERVRAFLEFLEAREKEALSSVVARSGPLPVLIQALPSAS
jgi:hypothetical protein